MDTQLLDAKFARIGARLKFADRPSAWGRPTRTVSLDVRADRRGEFFEIAGRPTVEVAALDVQPADRHLLLLVRAGGEKSKFLCGHDERHWFVAAVPEAAPVGTVRQAKEALKPPEVIAAQAVAGLRVGKRDRRRNAAFVRQGEWFFLPTPDFAPDPGRVFTGEALRRGDGGKPHWVDLLARTGGSVVHVCRERPNGLSDEKYHLLLAANPKAKAWGWRVMTRDATVHVRGQVRHADHATITLPVWHRVVMNTESQAKAKLNVAFLD